MEHKTNSEAKQILKNKQTDGKWIKEPRVTFWFPWQQDKQAECLNELKSSHTYTLDVHKFKLNNKDDNQTEWQSTDKLTLALQVQNQLFYSMF